jgi:hypothetical protein
MNDSSRIQGTAICIAVGVLGLWFLVGLLQESYWAIAIPVAIVVLFALGLSFWIGYTIATVQVEPEIDTTASESDADVDRPA